MEQIKYLPTPSTAIAVEDKVILVVKGNAVEARKYLRQQTSFSDNTIENLFKYYQVNLVEEIKQ